MFRRNTIDHIFYYLNLLILQLIIFPILIILVFRLRKRFFATKPSDRLSKYQKWFYVISVVGAFLTLAFMVELYIVNFGPYSLINLFSDILGYIGLFLLFEGFLMFLLLRFKTCRTLKNGI